MNTTTIALLVGFLVALGTAFGGFVVGRGYERQEWQGKEAARVDKILTKQEVIIKEVPKIVTHVVTVETTTEKEYTNVITKVPDLFDPDCVMPKWWGELFINTANGQPIPDPRGFSQTPGAYGCVETAQATLKDLKAGTINTARLGGIQQWAKLVTSP